MTVLHMNCLDGLRVLGDNSVDSIVTDPPYGLSFMGKKWDYDVPSVEIWAECLRVLKPGGHLLAFAGTRTQHRMAVRIEDAGFEIRDMIAWCYGSGFPKSQNVSLAMDKKAGAVGHLSKSFNMKGGGERSVEFESNGRDFSIRHEPATEAARQWQGWGTALKPALEPITVARKPLSAGTVSANVLQHGTGALNIDACRVPAEKATGWGGGGSALYEGGLSRDGGEARLQDSGRWPANLIHDGSVSGKEPSKTGTANCYGKYERVPFVSHNDTGSAARFFYCAKTSKADRGEGNNHPTVKPTDLMRYLCRLVTPPGGLVLDPFTGSGSTGKAAKLEGFRFIGFELSEEYVAIARARIDEAVK